MQITATITLTERNIGQAPEQSIFEAQTVHVDFGEGYIAQGSDGPAGRIQRASTVLWEEGTVNNLWGKTEITIVRTDGGPLLAGMISHSFSPRNTPDGVEFQVA